MVNRDERIALVPHIFELDRIEKLFGVEGVVHPRRARSIRIAGVQKDQGLKPVLLPNLYEAVLVRGWKGRSRVPPHRRMLGRRQTKHCIVELHARSEEIGAGIHACREFHLSLNLDHGRTHAHVLQEAARNRVLVVLPLEEHVRPDRIHSHPCRPIVQIARYHGEYDRDIDTPKQWAIPAQTESQHRARRQQHREFQVPEFTIRCKPIDR